MNHKALYKALSGMQTVEQYRANKPHANILEGCIPSFEPTQTIQSKAVWMLSSGYASYMVPSTAKWFEAVDIIQKILQDYDPPPERKELRLLYNALCAAETEVISAIEDDEPEEDSENEDGPFREEDEDER